MKGYIPRPAPLGLRACALALTLLLSTLATAGIEQGYDAFERGDVAGAVRIWRDLAEQGNTTAQFNLGQLYRLGNGVTADDREALDRYIKSNKIALQQRQLLVVAIRRDNKDWHVLFLGPFSDKGSARQTRDALPEALAKDDPWIRTVSSVQAAAGPGPD